MTGVQLLLPLHAFMACADATLRPRLTDTATHRHTPDAPLRT